MKVELIKNGKSYGYDFANTKELEKDLKNKASKDFKDTDDEDKLVFSFKTDPDYKKLRLLVILSPIFIAIFDNGKTDLEFFRNNLTKSNFTYGLYEKFFQDFSLKDYLNFYQNHEKNEDIMVDENLTVSFTINEMDPVYILALAALIEGLILDDKTREELLDYFAKMRNDIVINGRRSILANSIQAFYLSKYVVAWALDLYKIIEKDHPDLYPYIIPIYELTNNLKTPSLA